LLVVINFKKLIPKNYHQPLTLKQLIF